MAGVVAFELVARAGLVERLQRIADVLEAVAEDEIVRALQHRRLPCVLEGLEALEHREQPEIHRAHVEAGDLGLPYGGGAHPLLDRHIRRSAGGEVDHDVRRLLDDSQERLERLGALVGPSVFGVAGVEMDDRRARLGGAQRGLRDLLRRHGRCGDIDGVWIEPVTAHEMMTLFDAMMATSG